MKSPPTRFYVASVLLAVALFPLLLLATYVAGYFLLQDERGLFSARWQFEFYKPAVDFERWATREPVNTG